MYYIIWKTGLIGLYVVFSINIKFPCPNNELFFLVIYSSLCVVECLTRSISNTVGGNRDSDSGSSEL